VKTFFFKSVKIRQNYGHESVASLFGPPCIVIKSIRPAVCVCHACIVVALTKRKIVFSHLLHETAYVCLSDDREMSQSKVKCHCRESRLEMHRGKAAANRS